MRGISLFKKVLEKTAGSRDSGSEPDIVSAASGKPEGPEETGDCRKDRKKPYAGEIVKPDVLRYNIFWVWVLKSK